MVLNFHPMSFIKFNPSRKDGPPKYTIGFLFLLQKILTPVEVSKKLVESHIAAEHAACLKVFACVDYSFHMGNGVNNSQRESMTQQMNQRTNSLYR